MRFSILLSFVTTAGSVFCLCQSPVLAADELVSVGVAEVDITPEYPIRLNGFGGRRTESEGITQRIWAKALAIGADEQKPLILYTVDSLGVRMSMVDEVARRLKEKVGIDRQQIALTFTHSHTTPKVNGACDTIFSSPISPEHQERIDRYTAELTDALETVALAALADQQPARLEWAVGKVGFAKNRRTEGGPVDHDLPMLVAKSPTGEIRAIYVTYACHCVTLSDNKISGDWAGYAQEAIEHKHPGAIALVSIGCGSDSNPSSGVTGDNIAAAAEQGGEIADEVDRLLRGPLRPISGPIVAQLQNIELPLNALPTRDELETLALEDSPAGYNAKFQLAKLDRGEPLQAEIDYPIQTFVFGDSLAMVFLAGEVCVDYSLRLKQELAADRVWLHGYSSDFCAYIPSERLVAEGGYGGGAETVYFALPATLKAGLEEKIVAEVRQQLPKNFHHLDRPKRTSRFEPTAPEDALAAIQVGEDFVVELVAAEPLVVDPVAIDFGSDGSLWVAEMRDYGHEVDDEFEQTGCISHLGDRDGDGRPDQATAFQTGLRFPTDVKVWRKGVIVCDAPEVIYLEDTDGDGRADFRKVLLSGFETHNAQARVNSLRWGLDNWLYGSCGLFGGSIRSFNGQKLELGGRDFCFKPDSGEIEAVTGRTQQGRARDDWDNWFGCDSGTLCKHYPLAERYLARNPFVIPPATERYVPAGPDAAILHPLGQLVLFKQSGPPGRPTSACGLEVYRDELLGKDLYGNIFVAEPVNQIVHRRVFTPRGITFEGYRAKDEVDREFLASTDPWFRPVQVRTGTDGCLWIVDMCRYVIEHPRFIPEETLRTLDVQAGNKAGRIFRVRPKDRVPRALVNLNELDAAGLVAALDSPNGPQRDLAQRAIIDRGDRSTVTLLENLVLNAERPAVRLQALCALDGLAALSEAMLSRGLQDAAAGVRRHSIRLSEPLLDSSPQILATVIALAEDNVPQIQLQLAYSLGESRQPHAAEALAELAKQHGDDPDLQAAILCSVNAQSAVTILDDVLPQAIAGDLPTPLRNTFVTIASNQIDAVQLRDLLLAATCPKREPISSSQLALFAELLEGTSAAKREQIIADGKFAAALPQISAAARQMMRDDTPDDAKLAALRALTAAKATDEDWIAELGQLLSPRNAPEVQLAAVGLLAGSRDRNAAAELFGNFRAFTPETRAAALKLVLSQSHSLPKLIDALSRGDIHPGDLDALDRQRLLQHEDVEIRAAAAELFAGAIHSDRQRIMESFADAAQKPGNSIQGRELFRKHCANCHRLEDHGFAVGPDLAALSNRNPAAMLEALFDPNRAVDQRYQSYTAVTEEGLVYTGILQAETANSVTLLEQAGKQHTLLRSSLELVQNNRVSLMPEGFEKDLSGADVAHLLTYLATQGQQPKKFAGNEPKIVAPRSDGSITLLAADCEIYGPYAVYESAFQNVGYWHDKNDHVVWTVELPSSGEYNVYLNAACAEDAAGTVAAIDGLSIALEVAVPSTGGWDRYQAIHAGQASLPAGRHRIVVRPAAARLDGALMDLRGLWLVSTTAAVQQPGVEPFDPLQFDDAANNVFKLQQGLEVGSPREYERIPAIFGVAIEAGKRNQETELRRLLQLSVPQLDEPVRHWQAVVVGGGIINGLTQAAVWPRPRISELLDNDEHLQKRWQRLIELSAAMADDERVPKGTRYDALRILGADTFENRGDQLIRYLQHRVHGELQMGAISALADMDHESATQALLDHLTNFELHNRELAIAGLMRSERRIIALLSALESGAISLESLPTNSVSQLKNLPDLRLRERVVEWLEMNRQTKPD